MANIIGKIFLLYTGITTLLLPVSMAQRSIDQFDMAILNHLAEGRTPTQTKIFRTISDVNNYVNVGVPAALLLAGTIDNNKAMRQNALYIATSTATTAILNSVIKHLFKRKRPFKAHVNFVPVYESGGYSFPSGHTSSTFSTMTALSRAYPKWYVIAPSLLWASSIGYSRLYLGVHHPTDVGAGAILGAGAAFGFGFIRP
ncbi:undecaprenyl-diphosphatase [bacterium A37T11]|nr:undecaprenyl-diphosphatase [bacterium A37T11]